MGPDSQLIRLLPLLWEGMWVTVQLAVTAMVLSLLLALVVLGLAGHRFRTVRLMAGAYVAVFRGLPELLVILLVFFGSAPLLNGLSAGLGLGSPLELAPFWAGVLALALVYGAYATEALRGALQNIATGLHEAGRALGLSAWQRFVTITWPLLWRAALPPLGNLFIALLKDTSLVAVIGAQELMRSAQIAVNQTREPFTFYLAATILYLLLTAAATWLLARLERRARLDPPRPHPNGLGPVAR